MKDSKTREAKQRRNSKQPMNKRQRAVYIFVYMYVYTGRPLEVSTLQQYEILLLRRLDDGKGEHEAHREDAEQEREHPLRDVVYLLGQPLPVAGVRRDKELGAPQPREHGRRGPSLVTLQSVLGSKGRGDGVGGGGGGGRLLDVGVGEHAAAVGLQKGKEMSQWRSVWSAADSARIKKKQWHETYF